MSNGVVDKFWQSLKPLRKVGKLRGIIDVPTFTAPCGGISCLKLENDSENFISGDPTNLTNVLTIAGWIKIEPTLDNNQYVIAQNNLDGSDARWQFSVYNRRLRFAVETSDFTAYLSSASISANKWIHVAVRYNNHSCQFIINGVEDTYQTDEDIGNIAATVGDYDFIIGGDTSLDAGVGYVSYSHILMWNAAIDTITIREYMNRDPYKEGLNLKMMFKFNEGLEGAPVFNWVTGNEGEYGDPPILVEDWPTDRPIYGASFIVGEFTLETTDSKPFSLKFPVAKPDSCTNFVLCIRWTEDDCDSENVDEVTRYQFWHVTGEKLFPGILDYNGEKIPSGAVLEVWNIDGNLTVDLEATLELVTSLLHKVTDNLTVTQTRDLSTALTTLNRELAEEFDLEPFPLTFSSEQEY